MRLFIERQITLIMHIPPLHLPDDSELPQEVVERLRSLPPIAIYRLIASAPQFLKPWTDMVSAVYASSISPRLREIAILRQAACAKAHYELHQHTQIALSNGLSSEEIKVIIDSVSVTSLSPEENLVCKISEQLEQNATLDDETYAEARTKFGDRQFIELVTLISFYCAVGRFLNATRLEVEAGNPLQGLSSPTVHS